MIHNIILHFEKTVSDYKYSEFNPSWGSVISRECGDPKEALGSVSLLLEIGLLWQESSCEETKIS